MAQGQDAPGRGVCDRRIYSTNRGAEVFGSTSARRLSWEKSLLRWQSRYRIRWTHTGPASQSIPAADSQQSAFHSAAAREERDPVRVPQIAYQEGTADKKLPQPVFLGLRDDKGPSGVVLPERR